MEKIPTDEWQKLEHHHVEYDTCDYMVELREWSNGELKATLELSTLIDYIVNQAIEGMKSGEN